MSLLLLFSLVAMCSAAPFGKVIDIPRPFGYNGSIAVSVAGDFVCVIATPDKQPGPGAFSYRISTGELKSLRCPDMSCDCVGVTSAGLIAGNTRLLQTTKAILWVDGRDVIVHDPSWFSSYLQGINEQGYGVGWYVRTSGGMMQPFILYPNRTVTNLPGVDPARYYGMWPTAINSRGEVVGYVLLMSEGRFTHSGFIYSPSPTPIVSLLPSDSALFGISQDGQTVVGSIGGGNATVWQFNRATPFWVPRTFDCPTPGPVGGCRFVSVNSKADIVGFMNAQDLQHGGSAFMLDQSRGSVVRVSSLFPSDSSISVAVNANSIDDQGCVVGSGASKLDAGHIHGYVLIP